MIKSGGFFSIKGANCVIGAIVSINKKHYIATASHIFEGDKIGTVVQVGGFQSIVKKFLPEFDIVLIELPSGDKAEVTELGRAAVMEDAQLINERHSTRCRVIRAGAALHSLLFPCFDMPQPGDSGSPILQNGKVIGLLSSVTLGNCTGTAVSSDVLRDLNC
ncbi:MAG TPA: serine protease [Candidatus Methanoperedens sp.]